MARDGLSPPSTRAAYDFVIESLGGRGSLPQSSCSGVLPLAPSSIPRAGQPRIWVL